MKNLYICIRKVAAVFALLVLFSIPALNAEPFDARAANEQQFNRVDNCVSYFEGTTGAESCREGEIPTPAATWLFLLVLIAFVGLSNKRKL